MLLAVRAFFPNTLGTQRTKHSVIPSYTDNRGNGSLLNKLMSSKYPLSGEQPRQSGVRPDVRWTYRERRTVKPTVSQMGTARDSTPRFVFVFFPPVGGWFILDDALALGAEAEDEKQR